MAQIFFDTYALIELIEGNHNYSLYVAYEPLINDFVLAELYYGLLRDYGERWASKYSEKYCNYSLPPSLAIIKEAGQLRLLHKKKNLSLTDCIGYCQAKRLGIKFLTGDQQFRNFSNVEFVK